MFNDSVLKAIQSGLMFVLMLLASMTQAAENFTYITTDHLGSPILATDQSGAVLWREHYQPYGRKALNEDGDNSVGFTGHREDKSLGVTYMQGRWYHPDMGRFMALDPVRFVESNPISVNRYAYANNNPYVYVDPDGRQPTWSGVYLQQQYKKAVNQVYVKYAQYTGTEAAIGLATLGLGKGVGVALGKQLPGVIADGAKTVAKKVDPKSLIGRQSRDEMSGSQVKRLRKNMKENGFDPSKPIEAANVDGKLIILDGHHRTKAAIGAGIKEVPVNVQKATREQGDQLLREAAEARL